MSEISATFGSVADLRNIVQSLSEMLTDLTFKLIKREDPSLLSGIEVFSLDSTKSCIMKVTLEAAVDGLDDLGSIDICVNAGHLFKVLRQIPGSSTVKFSHSTGQVDTLLNICHYEIENSCRRSKDVIQMLEVVEDEELDTSCAYDLRIKLELQILKDFLQKASEFSSEDLTLMIERSGSYDETINKVTFKSDGVVKSQIEFFDFPDEDVNKIEIDEAAMNMRDRPDENTENYRTIFEERFSLKFLKSFLKPLSNRAVVMNLLPQMPMRIDYSISELSNVAFFIGPKNLQ